MKRKNILIALILCNILVVTGCGKKVNDVKDDSKKAVAIEVMSAKKGNIENSYLYSGKVKPIDEVNIVSTVSGKVASVNFKVGDKVKKGDVLFTMETEDIVNNINVLKASLASIDANIESAKTSVELVNGAAMQTQIENAKAAVMNTELIYNNTKTTYENNRVLFETGAVSKTVMDQIEMSYKQAETAYNQAKETYDIVKNKMPQENLRKAQDSLAVAQASRESVVAQIKSAEKTLNDASVKSPISGVVTMCNAVEGTVLVQSASPAFVVINMDKVNIDVSVSEQIINSLLPEQDIDVVVSVISEKPMKGKIKTINPAANQSGTYDVKIELENSDGKLKSGMFGQVYFTKDKSQDTIVLPRSAVMTKSEETYIFVNENGLAKRVLVELGIDNGDDVEIKSGVNEGMNVIIKGQQYVNDGDKVEIASEKRGK